MLHLMFAGYWRQVECVLYVGYGSGSITEDHERDHYGSYFWTEDAIDAAYRSHKTSTQGNKKQLAFCLSSTAGAILCTYMSHL